VRFRCGGVEWLGRLEWVGRRVPLGDVVETDETEENERESKETRTWHRRKRSRTADKIPRHKLCISLALTFIGSEVLRPSARHLGETHFRINGESCTVQQQRGGLGEELDRYVGEEDCRLAQDLIRCLQVLTTTPITKSGKKLPEIISGCDPHNLHKHHNYCGPYRERL
jgi:hypothetical protein